MVKNAKTTATLLALGILAAFSMSPTTGKPYAGNPGDCRTEDTGFQSADGGCKDLQTGRVWSASMVISTGSVGTWSYTRDYCKNLVEGGRSDWRVPTRAELETLAAHEAVDTSQTFLPYDTTAHVVFSHIDQPVWSSTRVKNKAWAIHLRDGQAELLDSGAGGFAIECICVRP